MKLQVPKLATISQRMRTEGFQRAIGKPSGRARRRETFCICKHAYKTCKKNEAKYFVNALAYTNESRRGCGPSDTSLGF